MQSKTAADFFALRQGHALRTSFNETAPISTFHNTEKVPVMVSQSF
jgi:hypothetical protein